MKTKTVNIILLMSVIIFLFDCTPEHASAYDRISARVIQVSKSIEGDSDYVILGREDIFDFEWDKLFILSDEYRN